MAFARSGCAPSSAAILASARHVLNHAGAALQRRNNLHFLRGKSKSFRNRYSAAGGRAQGEKQDLLRPR
jgi:hypothetical protein